VGQVSSLLSKPQLLLREFHRYTNLLERPRIKALLSHEREILLQQLHELVDRLEADFDHRTPRSV
jgi:hypothetical protein